MLLELEARFKTVAEKTARKHGCAMEPGLLSRQPGVVTMYFRAASKKNPGSFIESMAGISVRETATNELMRQRCVDAIEDMREMEPGCVT